jgi:hypothetical protein
MKYRNCSKLLIYPLMSIILLSLNLLFVGAQETSAPTPLSIYVLVEPLPQPGSDSEEEQPSNAYVLQFRNTEQVGVVLPVDSRVVVYSTLELIVETYGIRTDATTGAYKIAGDQPTVTSSTTKLNNFNSRQVAGYEFLQNLTQSGLLATRPFEILGGSEMIAIGENGGFSSVIIQGTMSFNLQPDLAAFQVVQLGDEDIELGLPALTAPTPFILLSNRDFTLTDKIQVDGVEVLGPVNTSYARNILNQLLNYEEPELFNIMRASQVRIHPFHGLTAVYTPGRFLLLVMNKQPSPRLFQAGQTITPLIGSSPAYYDSASGRNGNLNDGDVLTVISVDDEGRLYATSGKVGQGAEIEAWLVE